MADALARLRRFLRELRRRKVYRVAGAYAAVAFVVLQVAALVFEPLGLPEWAMPTLIVFVALGFPVALVVAWGYELGPEGVRRENAGDAAAAGARATAEPSARPVGAGTEVSDRSVAVLPFQNMGGEESVQFTRGIHDDLLTGLSSVGQLRVISRTSVERYRETEKGLPAIARELGVRWVVEGGVQRAGDRIKVNAQLIDAARDAHRWAKSYERELTADNVFDIQGELRREIARSLEARLTSGERARMGRRPTDDLEAYRFCVEGRAFLDQETDASLRRAMELFRRAADRDPAYPLARAGLADAHMLLVLLDYEPPDRHLPRAEEEARRALDLDPELAEGRAALGGIHLSRHDGPEAVRELRRAVELRPSDARVHNYLGATLGALGRLEEGLALQVKATELDPLSASMRGPRADFHRLSRQPEVALEHARRAEAQGPSFYLGPLTLGNTLSALGRQEEAIGAFRRALERTSPGPTYAAQIRAGLAIAHLRAGDEGRAREILAEIDGSGTPFFAALVHAQTGDRDAAFDRLERADPGVFIHALLLRYDPALDPLRDDPRFRELIRRVNVAWRLEPDGSFPTPTDAGPGRLREARPDREPESGAGTDG